MEKNIVIINRIKLKYEYRWGKFLGWDGERLVEIISIKIEIKNWVKSLKINWNKLKPWARNLKT